MAKSKKNLKSQARQQKRKKNTLKEVEVYNKIQNRFVNSYNLFSVQPLEELEKIKNNKMSATDRNAFDEAYRIIKTRTLAQEDTIEPSLLTQPS